MRWRLIGSTTVAVCALLVAVGAAQAGEPGGTTWETLVACLNAHGIQTPATNDPVQLKTWLGERSQADPGVDAALEACTPDATKGEGSGPSLVELVACLRSQGLQPPDTTDPQTLKTWLGEQSKSDPAVQAALKACAPPLKKETKETTNQPSLTELEACLVQAGINVPDGVNLKEWLGRVVDQARVKQALQSCGVTMAKKRTSSKNVKVMLRLVAHR